jgi:hypothetical protein
MADKGNFIELDELLNSVEEDYFDVESRETDSEDENSDWTSDLAWDERQIELDFSDSDSESNQVSSASSNNNIIAILLNNHHHLLQLNSL